MKLMDMMMNMIMMMMMTMMMIVMIMMIVLNTIIFQAAVTDNSMVLVEFYAPWYIMATEDG